MFTGIVTAIGKIVSAEPTGPGADDGVRLRIFSGELALSDVAIGDSIAIQGACMTVIQKDEEHFVVEVSRASLMCAKFLTQPGNRVNLEKALCAQDSIGGHFVTGHIDGLGVVKEFAVSGESRTLRIWVPARIGQYLAPKGSVTINGVSLTVNQVIDAAEDATSGAGSVFTMNIIAHTLRASTLQYLEEGAQVNVEADLLARYVARCVGLPTHWPKLT